MTTFDQNVAVGCRVEYLRPGQISRSYKSVQLYCIGFLESAFVSVCMFMIIMYAVTKISSCL
jgi:hypothetical protein